MEYFNLVTFTILISETQLSNLHAYAKVIKLDLVPQNISEKDQEIAYSDKTVFQVVPYPENHEYSYPVPVTKSNDRTGVKVYELHPVPVAAPPIVPTNYAYIPAKIPAIQHGVPHLEHEHLTKENPLITALMLSGGLGVPAIAHQGTNHPDLVAINPYIALLLSQYGRYLPVGSVSEKGIYFYSAANNYHNNKPFGSYKVYEDSRR